MAYYTNKFDEGVDNVLPGAQASVALAVGDIVYRSSAGLWQKAISVGLDIAAKTPGMGVMTSACLAYDFVSPVKAGIIRGYSSLTIGAKQYLSAATAGTVTATAPKVTQVQVVGVAISATEIAFDIEPVKAPAQYTAAAAVDVVVPSITDPDLGSVAVDVSASFVTTVAIGDSVVAIPLEAMPSNCLVLNAYVSAEDTITVVFGSEGGNVTGATKEFNFLLTDLA